MVVEIAPLKVTAGDVSDGLHIEFGVGVNVSVGNTRLSGTATVVVCWHPLLVFRVNTVKKIPDPPCLLLSVAFVAPAIGVERSIPVYH
jgi:hypothetical protein